MNSHIAIRCVGCGRPTGGICHFDAYNELSVAQKTCNSCRLAAPIENVVEIAHPELVDWECNSCGSTDTNFTIREYMTRELSGELTPDGIRCDEGSAYTDNSGDYEILCPNCGMNTNLQINYYF